MSTTKHTEASTEEKCPGCDESLTATKEPLIRADIGKIGRNGWKSSGCWGTMHQRCFLIAIGDPKAIEFLVAQA